MILLFIAFFKNDAFIDTDGAMHFIYAHKYNTNSAEDSSDMNGILFSACICDCFGQGSNPDRMSESPSR